jgi:hypothetical protein
MFEENRQGPADGKTNFWGKVKMSSYTPPVIIPPELMRKAVQDSAVKVFCLMKRWMSLFLLAEKLTFCKVCILGGETG